MSAEKSKVYFSRVITPENVVKLYEALGVKLQGKIAVKVHSGEEGNQNYLRPEFIKPMVEHLNGTVVECNTAYGGKRNTTKKHLVTIKRHGWSELFNFDLLDAEGPDISVPVKNGFHLKEDFLGKNIENYDSMLVLSHFKGHPMGGYGGALKQLSIGCASSKGKAWIHSAGKNTNQYTVWLKLPKQDDFLESMADAASAVVDYFKGKIAYINIMCNLSVDCDCCSVAEDPCMKDIGILSSLDPVAIDQACLDLIKASNDPGREHFMKRVESKNGTHTIDSAVKLGVGSKEYELIEI
jgi:uncharacterized Fe-S center protein